MQRGQSQWLTATPGSRKMAAVAGPTQRQRIYAVVRRIPRGRVATYGQVAFLAGLPGHARQVGYALAALPEGSRMPWHRVLNAQGSASPASRAGRTSLTRFQWQPRSVT